MRVSVFMAEGGFARLRRRIAETEGRGSKAEAGKDAVLSARHPPVLPFAVPKLDRMLGGGLRCAALHEIRCGESRDAAAATGFAVAVLSRFADREASPRAGSGPAGKEKTQHRPILWIVEDAAAHETGFPYGAGLGRFGLSPAGLIVVRAAKAADALWVFEEGLRCRGLSAVVTEIRGNPRPLDLTASRRLALRAREFGVMGLLLRQTAEAEPGAATTRWLVAPRPAATTDDYPAGIGNPVWRLTLERNRLGATGVFDVEWDHDRRMFIAAGPAHSLPVPPLSSDRSAASEDAGKVVALARAS